MISDKDKEKMKKVIELCKKKLSGGISQEDMQTELAYIILVEMFEDLKYKPLPIKPEMMEEYYALSELEKSQIGKVFWEQREVKKYIEDKEAINRENMSVLKTLDSLLAWVPEEDKENKLKTEERMKEFHRNKAIDENGQRVLKVNDIY